MPSKSRRNPKPLLLEELERRILMDAVPVVQVDAPATVGIGDSVAVTVTFDNQPTAGPNSNVGYGPWVDVFIDATGTDGLIDPTNPANTHPGDVDGVANPGDFYDGLTLGTNPSYLGASLTFQQLVLDNTANGGLGVEHPYAVDQLGNPIYVRTNVSGQVEYFNQALNSVTSTTPLGTFYQSGDRLLVIELPFGSFAPDQPAADISFSLNLSDHADLGLPLGITAVGGFRFGFDELDNPATDPSRIGTGSSISTSPVGTTLASLTKSYNGPENETATGPNYLRSYTINLSVADGQTLSNLNVFDDLPQELQYTQILSVVQNGATITQGTGANQYQILQTPSTSSTGGTLQIAFNSPTIGGSTTSVTVQFYAPRVFDSDLNGFIDGSDSTVLAPNSGADRLVDNQAYGFAQWTPIDPRDAGTIIGLNVDGTFDNTNLLTAAATAVPTATPEHSNLELSPLVIQKSVTTLTGAANGVTPGDLLEFTLNFQVSDYFAINNIIIDDVMRDGLRWDSSFIPTLEINGNTYQLTAQGWAPTNYTVRQDFTPKGSDPLATGTPYVDDSGGSNSGSTFLQFRVSQEMITRGEDGRLLGGGVDPTATGALVANNLPAYNNQATTGRIVYRAYILDEFADDFPSGEPPLNPRDVIGNSVDITADILDLSSGSQTVSTLIPYAGPVTTTDDSGTSLTIAEDTVRKDIYAINGIQRLVDPTNSSSAENAAFTAAFRTGGVTTGALNLQPGYEITYRLTYNIPTGDVENLRLTDYFPLPIFEVADPAQTGGSSWVFQNNLNTSTGAPASTSSITSGLFSGQITYGPSHTLHTVTNPYNPGTLGDINGNPESAYTSGLTSGNNTASNYLRIQWGDFANTTNNARQLDVLVTLTVSDSPFADGLFLTNQVQSGEGNTQSPGVEQEANAIIQIVINEPSVQVLKSVVGSTKSGGSSQGGLTFEAVTPTSSFDGTLTGVANFEKINRDLVEGALPDAGDTVRFALTAFNTGRADAFDVVLGDTIPGEFVNAYADEEAFATGTNLRVFRGDNTLLTDAIGVEQVVRVATTADLPSLTNISRVIDGITLANGDRILLKDQATPSENGIYEVTAGSSGSLMTLSLVAAGTGTGPDPYRVFIQGGRSVANANQVFSNTGGSAWTLDTATPVGGFDYVYTYNTTSKAFQVILADNFATPEGGSGALNRGLNISTNSDTTDGSNAILVLVDLTVDTDASANSFVTNTVTLSNYAGRDGGRDHTAEDKTDSALVRFSPAQISKTLVTSEVVGTDTVVLAATTADVGGAFDSGTGGGQFTGVGLTFDGVNLETGDLVLVKNQATASQNGIYQVTAANTLTRATFFNASAEATLGYSVLVSQGTTQANSVFAQQTPGVTLNTSAVDFRQLPTFLATGARADTVVAVATRPLDNAVYTPTGGPGGTGQILPAPGTIDGVVLRIGDRVLLTGQADATQNGIYEVYPLSGYDASARVVSTTGGSAVAPGSGQHRITPAMVDGVTLNAGDIVLVSESFVGAAYGGLYEVSAAVDTTVRAATTSASTLASSFYSAGGTSVGNQDNTGRWFNIPLVIDGVNLSAGDRVLLADSAYISNGGIFQLVDPTADATVRVATTGAVAGTFDSGNNRFNGVGASLTIDGVALADNDRVLVKDQGTTAQNGVYVYTTASGGQLTRASDFDSSLELRGGKIIAVTAGTLGAGREYFLQNTVATVNTSAAVFTEFTSGLILARPTDYDEVLEMLPGGSLGVVTEVLEGTSHGGLKFTSTSALFTSWLPTAGNWNRVVSFDQSVEITTNYSVIINEGVAFGGDTFVLTSSPAPVVNTDPILFTQSSGQLVRASDADSDAEMLAGRALTAVGGYTANGSFTAGIENGGKTYSLTTANAVLNTTNLTWTEKSGIRNGVTDAVPGEYVTYQLRVRVPEGTTNALTLTDTLGSGLAFVDVVSVTTSAGVTLGTGSPGAGTANNVSYNTGTRVITFGNVGGFNVTNANTDNNAPEFVYINYRAVALNTTANQAAATLTNSATVAYNFLTRTGATTSATEQVSGPTVRVVEPNVLVAKQISSDGGTTYSHGLNNPVDIGSTLDYRIVIGNGRLEVGSTAVQTSVAFATTGNLGGFATTGTSSGTGGEFPSIANGSALLDNATLAEGDRILVKDQTNRAENGIYLVTDVSGGNVRLTRAPEFDINNEARSGMIVAVGGGTYANQVYRILSDVSSLNSTVVDVRLYQLNTVTAATNGASLGTGSSTTQISGLGLNYDGTLGVDGSTLAVNDTLLVKDQSSPTQNGLYRVASITSNTANTLAFAGIAGSSTLFLNGITTGISAGQFMSLPGNDGVFRVTSVTPYTSNNFTFVRLERALTADIATNQTVQTGSAVLTRISQLDSNADFALAHPGLNVRVTSGTQNGGTVFALANEDPTTINLGSTAIRFYQPTDAFDLNLNDVLPNAFGATPSLNVSITGTTDLRAEDLEIGPTALVNNGAGYAAGTTIIAVDNFTGIIPTGASVYAGSTYLGVVASVNNTLGNTTSITLASGSTTAVTDNQALTVGILRTRPGLSFDLPVGSQIVLTVSGTVGTQVIPSQLFTNTATVSFTSLNDNFDSADTPAQRSTFVANNDDTERTSDSVVNPANNYTITSAVTGSIRTPLLQKTVTSTSLGSTVDSLVLADFTNTDFTSTSGTWSGQTTTNSTFVTVSGTATTAGSGTVTLAGLDLSSYNSLGLVARALSGHDASALQLRLTDADGTTALVTLDLNNVNLPPGDATFRLLTASLTAPTITGGTTSGFNWSNVSSLTLLGTGAENVRLDIDRVIALAPSVVPGEIVRYRLIVQIPETNYPDFQITDNLPTGQQFLNDGTAKVAFVGGSAAAFSSASSGTIPALNASANFTGDENSLTSLDLSPGSSNGYLLSDAQISTSATANNDTYNDGTDVIFRLGNILNNDLDPNAEYIILEYNALVLNTTANQAGVTQANSFTARINGSTGGGTQVGSFTGLGAATASASDAFNNVVIAEPQINNLSKTYNGTPPQDAGDAYTYEITFSNTTTAPQEFAPTVRVAVDTLGGTFSSGAGNPGTFSSVPLTSGSLVLDGQTLTVGDRILFRNNTAAASHGVYVVAQIDVRSGVATLVRATDFDSNTELTRGARVAVTAGSNIGRTYISENTVTTLNASTALFSPIDTINPLTAYNESVRVATTAALGVGTFSSANNRFDSVGASLSLDGISISNGDKVLVKNQANSNENGVYVYTTASGGRLTRTETFDQAHELPAGIQITAAEGTTNGGRTFALATPVTTLNDATNGPQTWNLLQRATAYDVVLNDYLDSDALFQSLDILTPGGNSLALTTTGAFTLGAYTGTVNLLPSVGASGQIRVTFDQVPPTTGSSNLITLRVNATVASNTAAGSNLTNNVQLSYTSLPGASGPAANANPTGSATPGAAGTATGERDGTGFDTNPSDTTPGTQVNNSAPTLSTTLNNYAVANGVATIIASPTIDKSFKDGNLTDDDSSLATTTGGELVVGETVTFDILVTLPEGVTQNVRITDVVPDGLFLTAYEVITTSAGSTRLAADFNGTVTSTPTPSTALPSGNGVDVTFDFGNITVSNDNLANNNAFVLRVTARVANTLANQGGTFLTNEASLVYQDPDGLNNGGTAGDITVRDGTTTSGDNTLDPGTSPYDPTVVVREPVLTISKAVSASGADAGDSVTYTLIIANPSGGGTQTAYDLVLRDILDANLSGGTISGVSTSGFSAFTAPVAGDFVITGNVLQVNAAGPLGGIIHIEPGATLQIQVQAVLADSAPVGGVIPNKADVFWSTLPGGLDGNDAATGTTERTGGDDLFPDSATVDPALLNNQAISSTVTVTTIAPVVVSHSIVDTSHAGSGATTGANATIGEVITYRVTVSLPEGTTRNLVIDTNLPTGLAFIPGSVVLSASHPDETSLNDTHPGTGTTAFNGTGLANPTVQRVSGSGNFLEGDDVRFRFTGPIVTAGDNNTSNNTFSFTYQVLVLDVGDRTPDGEANDGLGATRTSLTPTATYVVGEVVAATTANLAGATYNSSGGTGGRGAFTSAPTTLDGVTLADGNLILVKNQTTQTQNGIYRVTNAATGAWERWTEFDQNNEVTSGYRVEVTGGATNTGTTYQQATANVVVNASNIVFSPVASSSVLVDTNSVGNPLAQGITATVVEPELNIVKSVVVNGSGTSGDAGDPVTYTITITHTGNSNASAWDLNLTDALPAQLTNLSLVSAVISDGSGGNADQDVLASLNLTGNSLTTVDANGTDALNLRFNTGGASTSETLVVTITGNLVNSLAPGLTNGIDNTATVTYTTLPHDNVTGNDFLQQGDFISDAAGVTNGTDRERLTTDTSTVNITVPSTLTLAKSVIATSEAGTSTTNVTIGEVITYRLNTTLQDGVTALLTLTDDLPAGLQFLTGSAVFRSADGITAVGATSGTTYSNGDSILAADITDGGSGGNLVFRFTTVTVPATNGIDTDSFQVEYNVRALNVSGNQAETSPTRTNSATVAADRTGDGDTNDSGETSSPVTATITLVEPVLQVDKSLGTPPQNAGDAATYSILISHTGASSAPAYDLSFSDALPANIVKTVVASGADTAFVTADLGTAITVVHSTLGDVSAQFEIVGNTLQTRSTANIDLALGQTLTVTINGVVSDAIIPSAAVNNTASITWTSLDGSNTTVDANERFGGTGINDYNASDPFNFTSADYAPLVNKQIISTSEAATSFTGTNGDVLVGEVIRYQIKVELYEGTLNQFVILDNLPTGLQFLPGNVVISTLGVSSSVTGLSTGTFNATTSNLIDSSLTSNTDTYGNGTDIFFKLGDLINNDNDAGLEFVTIQFDALVLNTLANQAAVDLDNNFQVLRDTDNNPATDPVTINTLRVDANDDGTAETTGQSTSNTVSVNIVEPNLTVVLTSQTVNGDSTAPYNATDAGDTVTYVFTVTNNAPTTFGAGNAATAYDVQFRSELDRWLPANITADLTLVSAVASVTATDNSTGDTADLTVSSLAAGSSFTVTITATIKNSAPAGALVANSATVTYTSLPGANGTAAATPGTAGTTTGERTGGGYTTTVNGTNTPTDNTPPATADAADSSPNNYAVGTTTGLNVNPVGGGNFTVTTPTITKALSATSETATTGSDVAIGETLTYTLTVTIPEGETRTVSLIDNLPPGLAFVTGTTSVDFTGSGVTPFTAPTPVVTGTVALGQSLVWTIGTISNPAGSGADTFTLSYTVRVADLASNVRSVDRVNAASLTYVDPDGSTNSGTPSIETVNTPTDPSVNIVEPFLTVTKSLSDSTPDIGDVVTYTVTLTNPTNADGATAFDIRVRDAIPSGLTLNTDPATILINGTALNLSPLVNSGSNNSTTSLLDFELASLANGGSVTISYQATVNNSLALIGTTQDNNVRITYDSLAGDEASIPSGTPDSASRYPDTDGTPDRNYGPVTAPEDPTPTVDDPAQDTVRLTVNAASLSGYVYLDADNDGIFDSGEADLNAGISLRLTGTTATGLSVDLTTTTDANGFYQFTGLAQGTYLLTQTQPTGYLDGKETAGTDFGGTVDNTQVNQTISNIVIPDQSVANALNYNFGELVPASLSGTVYRDYNNNGIINTGEPGLSGVEVTLTGVNDFGAITSITLTTDASGNYDFTSLRPGTYTVTETQPTAYNDGRETAGSTGGTVNNALVNNTITTIPLTGAGGAPSTSTGNNFGELDPATISGFVYLDLDNDGVKDPAESGLAGITVTLTGTDDLGNAVNTVLQTGTNGAYSFTNLRPGTYTVTETQPTAYLDGQDTLGAGFEPGPGNDDGTTGADTFTSLVIASVNPANNSGTNYNFGEQFDANTAKSLVSTTAAHTTGNNLVVGESVRYRLVFDVPYGSVQDVIVRELLPQGLQFLNDNTATIALVSSNGSNLTSSRIASGAQATGPASGVTPSFTLANNDVSTSTSANLDAYNSGTDVFFRLGNLTNSETGSTPAQVVIEFNARVLNETFNQSATTHDNQFTVSWDRNGDGDGTDLGDLADTSNTITTTVYEPTLTVAKSVDDITPHLGQTLTYTVDVFNEDTANGTTAFDLTLTDVVPAAKFSSLTGITVRLFDMQGTAATANDTLLSTLTAGTDYTVVSSSTGWTITLASLAENRRLNIDYTAVVSTTPADVLGTSRIFSGTGAESDAFTNNVSLDWSSLPGNTVGERTGTDGPGGALNDYAASASQTVTVVGADLAVTKTDNGATATPGGTVTYTVVVRNNGTDTATSVVVRDTLPTSGITYASTTATAAFTEDTSVPGIVTWNLTNPLAAAASVTFTVVLNVNNPAPAGLELLTNTVEVSYNETTSGEDPTDEASDPSDDNDDADTTPLVAAPIITVVKDNTDPDDIVAPGDTLTYTLTIANTGNQNAVVDVRDFFPDQQLNLSTAVIGTLNGVTADTTTFAGDIFWNDVTLNAGDSFSITITATLFDPQLAAVDTFTNTVTVTEITGEVPPVSDDDTVDLDAFPNLVVVKTDGRSDVRPNETFQYTITASNIGDQNSTGVVVTDVLDPDLIYVSSSGSAGSTTFDLPSRTVTWNGFNLNGQGAQTETLTITVQLVSLPNFPKIIQNTAVITDDGANGPDVDLSNNTSTDPTEIFAYVYDSQVDFNPFRESEPDDWYHWWGPPDPYREALLPLMPMYSGHAEPGTTLVLTLTNIKGETIGTQTVIADAGGNWLATLPTSTVMDTPHSVVISQTPPSYHNGEFNGFNLRTYFSPAITNEHFFEEAISIQSVFAKRASHSLEALMQGAENPVSTDTFENPYEFLGSQGTPSGH